MGLRRGAELSKQQHPSRQKEEQVKVYMEYIVGFTSSTGPYQNHLIDYQPRSPAPRLNITVTHGTLPELKPRSKASNPLHPTSPSKQPKSSETTFSSSQQHQELFPCLQEHHQPNDTSNQAHTRLQSRSSIRGGLRRRDQGSRGIGMVVMVGRGRDGVISRTARRAGRGRSRGRGLRCDDAQAG